MKKLLNTIIVFIMLAIMTACGGQTDGSTVPDSEINTKETPSVADRTNEEESGKDSERTGEEASGEQDKEEPSADVSSGSASVDLSNAVTETTETEPAALGQWIEFRNTWIGVENCYYYWRVIGIIYDCEEDIDRYNSRYGTSPSPLASDDHRYCTVMYEVYYPEDYQDVMYQGEGTIPYAGVGNDLQIVSPEGTFISLMRDVSLEQDIYPGDVFSGRALYEIGNDVDYIFGLPHEDPAGAFWDYSASK